MFFPAKSLISTSSTAVGSSARVSGRRDVIRIGRTIAVNVDDHRLAAGSRKMIDTRGLGVDAAWPYRLGLFARGRFVAELPTAPYHRFYPVLTVPICRYHPGKASWRETGCL